MGSFSLYLVLSLASFHAVHCAHTTDTLHRNARSNEAEPFSPDEYESVAYCEAYCDVYGYYQPGKWCVSEDSSIDVYCCGNDNSRYCCADPSKDVGDLEPVKSCPNSTWFYHQWKVIVGLLSTLVVMLLLAACCYYCCGGNRQGYGRARGRFFASNSRTAPDEENNTTDPTFDPSSPYAFQPPEYSLPKDPPKYDEIISGVDNAAFDTSEGSSSNTEPASTTVNVPATSSTQSAPDTTPQTVDSTNGQQSGEAPPPVYTETDNGGANNEADGAATSRTEHSVTAVEIEIEAPPVYSEIDNTNATTSSNSVSHPVAPAAPIDNDGSNTVAAVHLTTPSSATNEESPRSVSRNVSVITHGSSTTGSASDLPQVESCLPPPYQEIPTVQCVAAASAEVESVDGDNETISSITNDSNEERRSAPIDSSAL